MATRVVVLGCTRFSEAMLEELLATKDVDVVGVFSIPEKFSISYAPTTGVKNSSFRDLSGVAKKHDVPFHWVDSAEKKLTDYLPELQAMAPDVILVLGWYYMVPASVRATAKRGAWGIHASMLPQYAGGAPLVWAMIEGESQTGVTLFELAEGVDDGAIVAQKAVAIEPTDTIAELYDRVTATSRDLLRDALAQFATVTARPQSTGEKKVWPQRSPNDGAISLQWDEKKLFDFIRAQSAPYPGAFLELADGRRLIFEKVRIETRKSDE